MNYDFHNLYKELLNFIKKKREDKEVTLPSQLLYLFCKSIKISLMNTFKEQKDLDLALHCVNIVESIFRIIYNYSLNIKLSIFICERSVLLFNEYINISKRKKSDKINIMDIKQFIINKSIGPVIIESRNSIIDEYKRDKIDSKYNYSSIIDIDTINNTDDNTNKFLYGEYDRNN